MVQRNDDALRNAVKGSHMYGTGPGRKDLGRVLEWGAVDFAFIYALARHFGASEEQAKYIAACHLLDMLFIAEGINPGVGSANWLRSRKISMS